MHHDLWAALDQASANMAIRALVITGAGRGFCAGADLSDFDLAPEVTVLIDLFAQNGSCCSLAASDPCRTRGSETQEPSRSSHRGSPLLLPPSPVSMWNSTRRLF